MDAVRQHLLDVSGLREWTEFVDQWTDATSRERLDWHLVLIGHQTVSDRPIDEVSLMAMVGALQLSIILVDNILDDDAGPHQVLGVGEVSNMALAFQASAFACALSLPNQVQTDVLILLDEAALGTAYGQHYDAQTPLSTEETYWAVVRAKSVPYYRLALAIGAAAAGATAVEIYKMKALGEILGETIQVVDDLVDAFAAEPTPDWMKRQNLAILYGLLVDHEARDELARLIESGVNKSVLERCQEILLNCGAVDYCQYVIQAKKQEMMALIAQGNFRDSAPLVELVERVGGLSLD